MCEMRAHRAKQRAEHASVGPGTDDEQIGVALTESGPGVSMEHLAHQLDAVVSGECCQPGELVADERAGAAVVVCAGEPCVDGSGRRPPSMQEDDGVTRSGMRERPSRRGMRVE